MPDSAALRIASACGSPGAGAAKSAGTPMALTQNTSSASQSSELSSTPSSVVKASSRAGAVSVTRQSQRASK